MADGYIIPVPIRKTVIKDSTIDFRGWRNKEEIGYSTVDFNGANIVSSLIDCQNFHSSTSQNEAPFTISPVKLLFNNLVLDRTNIFMSDIDASSSELYKLDFYDHAEVKIASTFRNSTLRLNTVEFEDKVRFEILADRCNWNNSTLRLDNTTITAAASDAGGASTFLINTDAENSTFNFRYVSIRHDENGNGNNFVLRGSYNNSTVYAQSTAFNYGPVRGGVFSVNGNLDFSLIEMADEAITDYNIDLFNLNLNNSDIRFMSFSNGTTAGTSIIASRVTMENSSFRIDELVNSPLLDIQDIKISNSSQLTIGDSRIPLSDTRLFRNYSSINNLVSIKVDTPVNIADSRVTLLFHTIPAGFVANKISYGQNLNYDSAGTNWIYLTDLNTLSASVTVNVTGPTFTSLEVSGDFTTDIIPEETVISFSYMYGSQQYWTGLANTVTHTLGITTITLMGPAFYAEASNNETLTSGVKIHDKFQSGFSYLSGEEATSLAKYLVTDGEGAQLALCSSGSNASGDADFILSGLFITYNP